MQREIGVRNATGKKVRYAGSLTKKRIKDTAQLELCEDCFKETPAPHTRTPNTRDPGRTHSTQHGHIRFRDLKIYISDNSGNQPTSASARALSDFQEPAQARPDPQHLIYTSPPRSPEY